ncbi:MAG: creatininase family protein [Planctomycetes bacterium]|nr:creatininase family protein [Planctomycetota bacterium]
MNLDDYLPQRVNSGPWLTSYTLHQLRALGHSAKYVLPICSIETPYAKLAVLGDLVLPPLFHEALDGSLKERILQRIDVCFPEHELSRGDRPTRPGVRVVEVSDGVPRPRPQRPRILAFSVDTAVEQHGPHLPLATDTIQSYAVLNQLQSEVAGIELGRPVEYGQLTWGLPFGFSIDLTAALLREYVQRFTDAMIDWLQPEAVYVVDVHGSLVHRQAIVEGLHRSRCQRWAFRWLYGPLAEFTADRKDQHAGGVETAMVERAGRELVDPRWWPDRMDEIAAGQMPFEKAVELQGDLPKFFSYVKSSTHNGVIGEIRNYHQVDAAVMFDRMMNSARSDVESLLSGHAPLRQDAGEILW